MNVFDNKWSPVTRLDLYYLPYNPNFPGGGGGSKGGGSTKKNPGGTPGLLTSTGGLYGTNGVLLTPVVNATTGKSYIMLMDPSNFNTEENAEYDFPQVIPQGHEGEDVSCHLIVLKYRELGAAQFSINITTYVRNEDTFVTQPFPVTIPPLPLSKARQATFPDERIHTFYISLPVITGERPQVTVTRNANSGPLSITSLTLCGNADQTKQL